MTVRHPREYIVNPQFYAFDPSDDFSEGEVVTTEDGTGTIVCQDSCKEQFDGGKFQIWLPRWGVQFAGCDRVRYYPIHKLKSDDK